MITGQVGKTELVEGWAMVQRARSTVYRPASVADICALFTLAQQQGLTIVPRGAGFSYADAALNDKNIVLDLSRMNHVTAWDTEQGIITVEPGVTISNLWRHVLPDGWWPPVVPGTMGPTIGGCLGMNIHGKNGWRMGSIGEHVLSFDILTPQGDFLTASPQEHSDLFYAAIGGVGMLGVITSATLQMQRVVSGKVATRTFVAQTLHEMFTLFAEQTPTADFCVGWIDGFAQGNQLGRGLVRRADFEHVADPSSLREVAQDLSPKIGGILPRNQMWRGMKLMTNDIGMRLANAGNMAHSARERDKVHHGPLAQFHFYHDYMPNWKRAWLPGGLRQFQAFLPQENAETVFAEMLKRSHAAKLMPYLCVFKQHRVDPFLLPYQLDGFSLSLDYHVTGHNARQIAFLLQDLCTAVVQAQGRLFLAKDDALTASLYAQSLGSDRIARFQALKREYDPQNALQSDLYRRLFIG